MLTKLTLSFACFDTAYQSFGSDYSCELDGDALGVCHLVQVGSDMLPCQPLSKNTGLYSKLLIALHVICKSLDIAVYVFDQLRERIRWVSSSAPAYNARLVEIVLSNDEIRVGCQEELKKAAARIERKRKDVYDLLPRNTRHLGLWITSLQGKLFSVPQF
jgi:Aspartate/tyrosine/aromatic aminotransferase